jgi:uncharacterized protein (TIGR03435 family)
MPDVSDMDLLGEFARNQSETAFTELVHRHINLVYSVAMRFTGNEPDAQDVTQAVFIILAKKSAGLSTRTNLTGWLYETTRFTAMSFLRNSARRQIREREAHMQSDLNESAEGNAWQQFAPHLEEAMAGLNEKDRALLALRYFSNKSGTETAALLGINEWAVHKRTSRALEKLRRFFSRRGLMFTTATIATAISVNSVQAAPALLAKSVSAIAITKGAAVGGSTLTLIKGALKIMAWSKVKTAVVIGVIALVTAGTTTVVVKKVEARRAYLDSWLVPNLNSAIVDNAPPQVRIIPTKFRPNQHTIAESNDGTKWGGLCTPISAIAWIAYEGRPARVIFTTPPPPDRFDFIASLPQGSYPGLQRELKNTLGWTGRTETREVDVLVLKVRNPNASGLKPPIPGGSNDWTGNTSYTCDDRALSSDGPPYQGLTRCLEQIFERPIIDQTGLTQHFSINLKWAPLRTRDAYLNSLKQALIDQLGLELVPDRQPVEMLVMEKVK